MVRSGAVDIVIVDSVAALVPKAEIDGEMGDSHVGLQARLMSQALRKLTAIISKSNCIVIFINQLREKVGVMFGNPEVTTGGRALKFYSSVRMDVRRIETLKQGGEVVDGSKIGQGRENAKQYLLSHPAICEEIEAQVRVKYNLPGAEEAEAQAREAAKKEEELTGSILPEGTEEELMAGEAEEE